MKINTINAKLKHKIVRINFGSQQMANESESNSQQRTVEFVQMSESWMKFVLSNSSATYLLDFSKLPNMLVERFLGSQCLGQDELRKATREWSEKNSDWDYIKCGLIEKFDFSYAEQRVRDIVGQLTNRLQSIAAMLNSNDSGLAPSQEMNNFTEILCLPHDINGYAVNGNYQVVMSNKQPYAISKTPNISNDCAYFTKLVDPLVWFGILLEEEGNIDEPNSILGITA